MAINFAKTSYAGHFPEIWRGECKMLPGGFNPVQTFAVGTVLHRGMPVFVDFEARTVAVCKAAKALAGSTTTKVRIAKGNCFQVGDKVQKVGATAAVNVTAIDTTNAEYDVLTVGTITGLAAGDVIVESDGQSTAAPKYVPNAVLGAQKEFDGKGIDSLDVAYEAVVLYPAVACPVLSTWVEAGSPCMKLNPNILFITQ